MQLGRSLALVSAILAAATVAACTANSVESPQSESPTDSNARMVPSSEAAGSIVATVGTPVAAPGTGEPMRIAFSADENTAIETGTLPSGGVARYRLHGKAGQILDAKVASSQPPVVLSIVGADGSELQSVSAVAQEWSGALPTTQYYYLDLNAPTAGGSEYSLTVSLGE